MRSSVLGVVALLVIGGVVLAQEPVPLDLDIRQARLACRAYGLAVFFAGYSASDRRILKRPVVRRVLRHNV